MSTTPKNTITFYKRVQIPYRVFPKYRLRISTNKEIARYANYELHQLCPHKEKLKILEPNIQEDHVHIFLSIPPKHSVSSVMCFLK